MHVLGIFGICTGIHSNCQHRMIILEVLIMMLGIQFIVIPLFFLVESVLMTGILNVTIPLNVFPLVRSLLDNRFT